MLVAASDGSSKPYPHPVLWGGSELSPQVSGQVSDIMCVCVCVEHWGVRGDGQGTRGGMESLLPSGTSIARVVRPLLLVCQVTVKGPRDTVYEFTTQVNIVPDTFPFPECHGAGCRGKLV